MSDAPESLPFGSYSRAAEDEEPRLCARLGAEVVDLTGLAATGTLGDEGELVREAAVLNPLLSAGRVAWRRLRASLGRAVRDRAAVRDHLVATESVRLHLPFAVADYVDFYSSIEHATNLGRILRPGGEPLLANWRHLPVGYHCRAGTVAVSGTPVRRPRGQVLSADGGTPRVVPSAMLDFELEVGFVTGDGPPAGTPIPVESAEDHIFGLVLVNDWSARDIQSWEYQPLGPFLAKSFLTSVSPWVVPLDALSSFRVDGPRQEPEPLPYLRGIEPRGLDLHLEVTLRSAAMVEAGLPALPVTSTTFASMYWSMAQQLAHLTVNGATVRAGDLCASGTVSGSTPGSEGSLMERTWRGTRPLAMPSGEERGFLEDGDEVTMTGRCGAIDFGAVTGTVVP